MTPSMPARVLGCDVGDRARCAGVSRKCGGRCHTLVRAEGDRCWHHRVEARALPRELVLLRDPRTGEPMEVG